MNPVPRRRCRSAVLAVVQPVLAVLVTVAAVAPPGPASASLDQPWDWPLQPQPEVVHPFVAPLDPYGPGHRGVDLAGVVGQPVLAVAPGRVSFAGSVAGRGIVVVDHGRLRTTYEPVLVTGARGDRVRRGDVLGTLTLTGGHCVPLACLHLGVRVGDAYLDPLGLLGSGQVRLLPLSGAPVASMNGLLHPWWIPLLL